MRFLPFRTSNRRALGLAVAVACAAMPVLAEKADRSKPIVVEADKPGTLDLQNQVVVFNGNVQIVQGTMIIRAERIEVRMSRPAATARRWRPVCPGSRRPTARSATASTKLSKAQPTASSTTRAPARCASSATARCVACAMEVADQITGAEIRWNDSAEQFSVIGGDAPVVARACCADAAP
jgi:lipopolysaccharide export system protein LptA